MLSLIALIWLCTLGYVFRGPLKQAFSKTKSQIDKLEQEIKEDE